MFCARSMRQKLVDPGGRAWLGSSEPAERVSRRPKSNTMSSPPQDEDARLVADMACGESEAFACLYDRYASLMTAVARRLLGQAGDVEDLVHDVFIEAWRNADGYDPGRATVRTWLLVRLRSRALDRRRSAKWVTLSRNDDGACSERPVETSEEAELAPDRAAIRRALQVLPSEQRAVLEMSYFDGLSSSEISERAAMPIGTVKSRAAAALAKLRTEVRKSDDEISRRYERSSQ